MFELPEAKRVRRSELFDSDSDVSRKESRSSSPVEAAATSASQAAFNFEYDVEERAILVADEEHDKLTAAAPADKGDEDTFEFRLFGSKPLSSTGPDTATRITIRSPTPQASAADGRFTNPYRHQHYYFTGAADAAELLRLKAEYGAVAVDGREVLDQAARTRWPGMSLPWRVVNIALPSSNSTLRRNGAKPTVTAVQPQKSPSASRQKRKPSKKRRILLRRRLSSTASAAAAEAAKRTARNREKKVKKRARERAKKLEAKDAAGENGGGEV